jgi:hypothetical protein
MPRLLPNPWFHNPIKLKESVHDMRLIIPPLNSFPSRYKHRYCGLFSAERVLACADCAVSVLNMAANVASERLNMFLPAFTVLSAFSIYRLCI